MSPRKRITPSVPPPDKVITIHLTAVYRSAAALLRELSRAVNRGSTRIKAESGLTVGTRLRVGLVAPTLERPVEIEGIVTGSVRKGQLYEMLLRYDFEPVQARRHLEAARAAVEREEPTRRPRREQRLPLALDVDTAGLSESVTTSVESLSKAGCRLGLSGRRLPKVGVGDRLLLSLASSARGLRRQVHLALEVRWVRGLGGAAKEKRLELGGRFVDTTPEARARIAAVVRLGDFRPRIKVKRIVAGTRRSRRAP